MSALPPFLRVPPFPGRRVNSLAQAGTSQADPAALAAALRQARVGGMFWGAQPTLAPCDGIVLAPDSASQRAEMTAALGGRAGYDLPSGCDPWWIAAHAAEVWAGADQELALVAALVGTPLRIFGAGRFAGCDRDTAAVAARVVGEWAYRDPFTGADWSGFDTIAQLGEWRRLIDANRTIAAVFGVARWKRETLDALLWDGAGPVRHAGKVAAALGPADRVVAWKTRTAPAVLAALARQECAVGELEDGMIRSTGLGANCVPPLSAIVDFTGVYFDPSGPSDLETLLETAEIAPELCARAAALRADLVRGAVSKYGQGGAPVTLGGDGRRRVLVTGQVEDDRSIQSGGGGMTNLALLARADRVQAPSRRHGRSPQGPCPAGRGAAPCRRSPAGCPDCTADRFGRCAARHHLACRVRSLAARQAGDDPRGAVLCRVGPDPRSGGNPATPYPQPLAGRTGRSHIAALPALP